MVSNNYCWANEHENPKKGARHEVDAFTMLVSKVDALLKKVDILQTNAFHGVTSSSSFRAIECI